ncbi:pyridoxal-dependent decarboxylase conserved domain protein [Aspergillus udagawae]|uniref:Pyridoxal-dependent decarboxylase conserved domain protein n=1 Tax=Aspergillus udagawae TaxID=91492 RepID=A0A8H3NZ21_9EURO|nr:pyridoxal-dependent decarboxylase conserved domain protein [Aspergillus udagawae]
MQSSGAQGRKALAAMTLDPNVDDHQKWTPLSLAASQGDVEMCIGLNQERYGALLSEATFSSTRLSAHWAAMTTKEDCFICVPLNRLPSEVNGGNVEEEKKFIREEILPKSNQELYNNDATKHTMTLLRALGSDLNINAFALNWRSPNEKPTDKDLYLTSTEFNHEEYGRCAEYFMDRLGISRSRQNLMVLRNVECRERNAFKPDIHRFFIQETNEIFLIYRPRFQEARFVDNSFSEHNSVS